MLRSKPWGMAVAACVLLAGCRTPPPSLNPFAGFGTPRVPPPATGSYGTPDSYYPSATPPPGSTSRNTGFQQTGSTATSLSSWSRWRAAGSSAASGGLTAANAVGSGVQRFGAAQAGFQTGVNPPRYALSSPTGAAPAAVGQPTTNLAGKTQLRPMPVNDATTGAAPGRFAAGSGALQISQLPRPVRPALPGANRLRGFAPGGSRGLLAPGVVPSASANPATPDTGWRPKYTPRATGGTLIR